MAEIKTFSKQWMISELVYNFSLGFMVIHYYTMYAHNKNVIQKPKSEKEWVIKRKNSQYAELWLG